MARPTAAAAVARPQLGPRRGEGCRPVVLLLDAYLSEPELGAARTVDGDDVATSPRESLARKNGGHDDVAGSALPDPPPSRSHRHVPPSQQMATRRTSPPPASVTVDGHDASPLPLPRGVPAAHSLGSAFG